MEIPNDLEQPKPEKVVASTATTSALRVEAKPYDPMVSVVVGTSHVVVGQPPLTSRPAAVAPSDDIDGQKRYPPRMLRHQDPIAQIQKATLDLQAGFRTGGPRERMLMMRTDVVPTVHPLVSPAYAPPPFEVAVESLAQGGRPVPAVVSVPVLQPSLVPAVNKSAHDPLESLVDQLVGLEISDGTPAAGLSIAPPPPPPPPPPPQEPMARPREDAGAIERKAMPSVVIPVAPVMRPQPAQDLPSSRPTPGAKPWTPSVTAKPWTPSVAAKPWTPAASAVGPPPPPPPGYPSPHTSPGVSTPSASMPSSQSTPQHQEEDSDDFIAPQTLRVDMDKFFSDEPPPVVVHETQTHLQSLQGVKANMPTVPVTAWYPVHFLGTEVFLPAPFLPEGGGQHLSERERPHFVTSRPSTHPNVKLLLVYYQCFRCIPNVFPGRLESRPPDLKLGGICGDVPALCIAHLIKIVTNVDLLAIDMFGHTVGRCNLWVKDQNDAKTLLKMLDKSIWMSPIPYGYAVVAPDEAAKEYLLWYLEGLRNNGPKSTRFPRHLMTCERWIV